MNTETPDADTVPVDTPEWPEVSRRRHILVVTLIAVAMSSLAVMLHEYAHAAAQLIAGAESSTVRAMSAEPNGVLSAGAQGWTAAAGPLFSLGIGIVVWAVARRLRGAAFQMAFWLYIACIQNMAGYLIITPFGVGDTAAVVDNWGWPSWAAMVMPILGAAMMFGLAWLVSVDVRARYRSVRGLRMAVMWPVLWATIILVSLSFVLALPGKYDTPVVFAMVMSMASVYVAAPMCSIFWSRGSFEGRDRNPGPLWFSAALAVLSVALWTAHGIVGVTIG